MRRTAGGRLFLIVTAMVLVSACGVEGTRVPDTATTVSGETFDAPGRLLVVGDWGSGTPSQEAVAAAMADHATGEEVSAILTTGDNFYSDDAERLMEPFTWATNREIPFIVTWGNHDIDTNRRITLIDETFDDPPRWVRHEWGPVDLVVLDSNDVGSPQQIDFLEGALSTSDDPTIIVTHNPPYSCGSHGDTEAIIDRWVSRFDDDVFLVLSGHEHNYQRFETDEVTYVVTGGGGAGLTELDPCSGDHPERVVGNSTHHFVSMELTGSLEVTAIDSDGIVIDEFSIGLP